MGTHNCGCKFNLHLHDYKRSDRRNPALRKESETPILKKLSFKPPNVNLIQRTMQVEQWDNGQKAATCIGPRALYQRNTQDSSELTDSSLLFHRILPTISRRTSGQLSGFPVLSTNIFYSRPKRSVSLAICET
jgi:hypothetical protein